jgi:hypothetical protein
VTDILAKHVGAGSLQKLSTQDRDLVTEGFYARTRGQEMKCLDFIVRKVVLFTTIMFTKEVLVIVV